MIEMGVVDIDNEYIKLLSAVANEDNPPYWFEGRDVKRDPLLVKNVSSPASPKESGK